MLQLLNRRAFVVTAHIIAVSWQWHPVVQYSLLQQHLGQNLTTWVGGLMHCQCGCSPVLFPINALHDSKLWSGEWGDPATQGECKAKAKKSKFCSSTYRQVVADFWLLWPDLVCWQPPSYQFSEVGGTSPSLKVFYVRQNKLEPSLGRFGKIRAVKGNLEALWGSAVALPPLGGQLAAVGGGGGVKRACGDWKIRTGLLTQWEELFWGHVPFSVWGGGFGFLPQKGKRECLYKLLWKERTSKKCIETVETRAWNKRRRALMRVREGEIRKGPDTTCLH